LTISRVSTGIEGFDPLVEGGFPRGDTILLIGNPGTGKTIFSAQFLLHGLTKHEPGIYVSFSENRETFLRNMASVGLDFSKYEKEGRFSLVDLMAVREMGVDDILTTIFEEMSRVQAKRLVIDSFTAIANALPGKADARMLLHSAISKISKLEGVTTLVISERPFGAEFGREPEEFVADGVVALQYTSERGRLRRKLQIVKMRGTDTNQAQIAYAIGKRGLFFFGPSQLDIVEDAFTEKLASGIQGIDKMLDGGFFKGSSTLISGYSGTGKTTIALTFIYEGAKRNQRGLFVSFEEPSKQLLRQANVYGWELDSLIKKNLVKIEGFFPEEHEIDELLLRLRTLVDEFKPERVVIDSMSALEKTLPDSEFLGSIKKIISYLKARGITVILTAATPSNSDFQETGSSTIVDNILSLRNVEIEGSLRKALIIFKARSSAHDKGLREFEITANGAKIGSTLSNFEGITAGVARRISKSVGAAIDKIDELFPADPANGADENRKPVRTQS